VEELEELRALSQLPPPELALEKAVAAAAVEAAAAAAEAAASSSCAALWPLPLPLEGLL